MINKNNYEERTNKTKQSAGKNAAREETAAYSDRLLLQNDRAQPASHLTTQGTFRSSTPSVRRWTLLFGNITAMLAFSRQELNASEY